MTLPELPDNRRWRTEYYILNNDRLILEEKRWWGWKKIAFRVIINYARIDWLAEEILKGRDSKVIVRETRALINARVKADRERFLKGL